MTGRADVTVSSSGGTPTRCAHDLPALPLHPAQHQGPILGHACAQISQEVAREHVLRELARIIDPDLGQDIVACGFVKDLAADAGTGAVSFALELTTPACPIKDEFERKARDYVAALGWVTQVGGPLCTPFLHARQSWQRPCSRGWAGAPGTHAKRVSPRAGTRLVEPGGGAGCNVVGSLTGLTWGHALMGI